MPIISPNQLVHSYQGYFGSYLTTDAGVYSMALDYSAAPTEFKLFHNNTGRNIVTREIEINMSTSGKVLLGGFGSGAALSNFLTFTYISSNTVDFTAPFSKNSDLFNLATHISTFDFQTGYTFYKLRLSVIGVSDPLFIPENGDNVIVTLNDDMTTRVVGLNWYITGHYV